MAEIITLNMRMADRTDPQLAFNTRSGGVALNGLEQVLSPLSERWRFSAVFPVVDAGSARTIRRVKSKLKGRFNYLLLRVCDQYRISRRDVGAWSASDPIPHSDTSLFSDGSGYAIAQPKSPIMAAAAANSSTLIIRASDLGDGMTAGVFFSVNYYLYQVDDWELVGETIVMQISPPLRAPVIADDVADFDAKCLWNLSTDDEGELSLQSGRFGSVTLNLVEPIGREEFTL